MQHVQSIARAIEHGLQRFDTRNCDSEGSSKRLAISQDHTINVIVLASSMEILPFGNRHVSNRLTRFYASDSLGYARRRIATFPGDGPLNNMVRLTDHIAQAIYVGADDQLGEQLQACIESKDGWRLQQVVDVDTASTIQCEQQTAAIILYVGDEYSYAQGLKFMQSTNCDELPVIVIYDRLQPEQLLELYRNGTAECLGRPANLTRLSLVLDMLTAQAKAINSSRSSSLRQRSAEPSRDTSGWHDQLMQQVRSVASLTTTLLITGETGTGKTRLSRLIHGLSKRKDRPFLALNCGALSESLIDTELFGHTKGAFTGADHDYVGKLAQCRDGTLLLDEIDTLSPVAQVKLLQVVEDRVFQPVGSPTFHPLQARLIVASNKPLQTEVDAGRFRSDLFYRLNVMSFELSPLRHRTEEIEDLAVTFAAEFANQHGFSRAALAAGVLAAFESYTWPGNIRELRNVMERAVILSAGKTIDTSHLPSQIVAIERDRPSTGGNGSGVNASELPTAANKLAHARMKAEREQLLDSLERNDNNRSKTAVELGISRVALYKRLRKLQLI